VLFPLTKKLHLIEQEKIAKEKAKPKKKKGNRKKK